MMASLSFRSSLRICRKLRLMRSFHGRHQELRNTKGYLVPIAVGTGTLFAGYQYIYKEPRRISRPEDDSSNGNLQLNFFRFLPLNAASRLWGKMNDINLPVWSRSMVLGTYVWFFNCNLDEAANPNLKDYENLGQFFRRDLKSNCRPVDKTHSLVSPSDGVLLDCGTVTKDQLEQVKGVVYTLSQFLGPQTFPREISSSCQAEEKETTLTQNSKDVDYEESLKYNNKNKLYHCIIYLAPGDYHRFHSPANWKISYRRHFPGYLFSVNPRVARRIPELFNLNERVVYFGNWQQGFFAMALVGATNVGSIRVYHDKELLTNRSSHQLHSTEHDFEKDAKVMTFSKGSPFGEFNLGSTIVLVFEAPESFRFAVKPGQKIKYGQALGS